MDVGMDVSKGILHWMDELFQFQFSPAPTAGGDRLHGGFNTQRIDQHQVLFIQRFERSVQSDHGVLGYRPLFVFEGVSQTHLRKNTHTHRRMSKGKKLKC